MPAFPTAGLTVEHLARFHGIADHRDVSGSAPSGGDVLAWNAGTGLWTPTTPGSPGGHVLASTSGLGASHTVSGLTAGQVLRATAAANAQFMRLTAADVDPGTFPAGTYVMPTKLTIGTMIGSSTGHALQVAHSAAAANAQMVMLEHTSTTSGAFWVNALQGRMRPAHTSGTLDVAVGLNGLVEVVGAGGTVTWARGVIGLAAVTVAATITNAAAVYADDGFVSGGGTIVNNHGFYAESIDTGTNRYGLYIEDIDGGTLNYAIYTNLGTVRFGGATIIGTDPGGSELLRVGGAITSTGAYITAGANAGVFFNSRSGSGLQWALYNASGVDLRFWASADYMRLTTTVLRPESDLLLDLGTSSLRWSSVYVGTKVVIGTDPGGAQPLRVGGNAIISGQLVTAEYLVTVGAVSAFFTQDGSKILFGSSTNHPVNFCVNNASELVLEATALKPFASNGLDLGTATEHFGWVYAGTAKGLKVNDQRVVTNRVTGYTNAMTGTANRATAYATGTITLIQLAERVKALEDDMLAHGLIGA